MSHLLVLVVALSGCAFNRESIVDKEADRVIALRNEIWALQRDCTKWLENNPSYVVFWDQTLASPDDRRKLSLLTNKKPVSKSYMELAKQVGGSYDECYSLAIPDAQSISPEYGQAYSKGVGAVFGVFMNIVTGKYKTYADVNQAMLATLQYRVGLMQAADTDLENSYLAAKKRERIANQQSTAAAMAVFGAMAQSYSSGYQNSNQNYQNTYQAPKTTNCRYIGTYLNCQSN